MSRVGRMLSGLRRDCWGCDNRIGRRRHRCTCSTSRTERAREKRRWQRDVKGER